MVKILGWQSGDSGSIQLKSQFLTVKVPASPLYHFNDYIL